MGLLSNMKRNDKIIKSWVSRFLIYLARADEVIE